MSTTPNLGLALPTHGQQNWDAPLNANAQIIDGVVGGGVVGEVLTSQGPGVPPTYAPNAAGTPQKEVPIGVIDGTNGSDGNAVFNISANPLPNTLVLTKNGAEMYEGVAYNIVGMQITYLAPYIPIAGDLHQARYSS